MLSVNVASGRLFRMAKKKTAPKKKAAAKKKSSARKPLKKKVPAKKMAVKKVSAARARSSASKSTARKVRAITEEIQSPMKSSLAGRGGDFGIEPRRPKRGLGSSAAGQSGDTEGISRDERDDSESVEELLEEGQSLEAEAVSGVENALDADQGEVRTHEVPEDDVPDEYGGEN
jgi:hypothetical protein